MWVGTSADLERLFKTVQYQYESLIPSHIAKELEHPREMLAWAEERNADLVKEASDFGESQSLASRRSDNDARLRKARDAVASAETKAASAANIELELTTASRDRATVTGKAAELVEFIDGETFVSFVAVAPSGNIRGRSIIISADRTTGIRLRVSSTDSQWCWATFAKLTAEIEGRVPRWKFVRSFKALLPFYFFLYFSFFLLGLSVFTDRLEAYYWAFLTVVFIVGFMLGQFALWTKSYIPAFEILASKEQQPRGIRFMRRFGSIGGAIALAVVGTAITNLLWP